MDSCSLFVDVSRVVNIVGLYTHVQIWLATGWQSMAEVELYLFDVTV